MKVLADFHHQGLYHSLHMLFEDRLGWELYRPIGKEWWEQGFWNVYDHPHTAEQFLGLHQGNELPMDVHGTPLPESERKNLHYIVENGVYYIRDLSYDTTHRAIRLDKFKDMEFDILLSSIPQHIEPYNKLIQLYQPKAKHIFQIGNRWNPPNTVKNLMASCQEFCTKHHAVFYHQEFDLNVFKYEEPKFHNIIHSYVHYMQKSKAMKDVISKLPGWTGVTYGAGMDQLLFHSSAVAQAIKTSAFTWHYKPGGDGFGHSIFSSYACGRPALIYRKHYRGCKADVLFDDLITCIDISSRNQSEILALLKTYSEPEKHKEMCSEAYKRFKDVCNFDLEFAKIHTFLENLI